MAARTRKIFHDEDTRNRIRAAAIIDRLQAFALGNSPDAMSRTQVAAATALLDKILPDVKSAEVKSEEIRTYVLRTPEPSASVEAWQHDFAPKHVAEQQLGPLCPSKA